MAHLKENASFKSKALPFSVLDSGSLVSSSPFLEKMMSFTNRLSGDLNQLREIDDPDTREKVEKLTDFLTHFQQFL